MATPSLFTLFWVTILVPLIISEVSKNEIACCGNAPACLPMDYLLFSLSNLQNDKKNPPLFIILPIPLQNYFPLFAGKIPFNDTHEHTCRRECPFWFLSGLPVIYTSQGLAHEQYWGFKGMVVPLYSMQLKFVGQVAETKVYFP